MQIDLQRYGRVRGSLRLKGVLFMALGVMALSFLGLFVLFGVHEIVSPGPVHPDHNRSEGAGVLCVVAVPFTFFAWLFRRGLGHWRRAQAFDQLIAGQRTFDAGPLKTLVSDGVARGFITEAQNAGVELVGPTPAPLEPPGSGSLFATLGGHAYAVSCFVLMALEKRVGRDLLLFVCTSGILLTFALHTVAVVGGFKARRSGKRPLAALMLGLAGYLSTLALALGTSIELVFGVR